MEVSVLMPMSSSRRSVVEGDRAMSAMVMRLGRRRNFRLGLGCLQPSSIMNGISMMSLSNGANGSRVLDMVAGLNAIRTAGGASGHVLARLGLASGTKGRMRILESNGCDSKKPVLILGVFAAKVDAMCFRNLQTGEV